MLEAEWTFRDLLNPYIGSRPIKAITSPEILAVLRRLESRGKHETAHRTKQRASRFIAHDKGAKLTYFNVSQPRP
jgi:hypothetical protein